MNRRGFFGSIAGALGIPFVPKSIKDKPLRYEGEISLAWGSGGTTMWYFWGEVPPSSCGLTHYHGKMTLPDGTTNSLYSFDKEVPDEM